MSGGHSCQARVRALPSPRPTRSPAGQRPGLGKRYEFGVNCDDFGPGGAQILDGRAAELGRLGAEPVDVNPGLLACWTVDELRVVASEWTTMPVVWLVVQIRMGPFTQTHTHSN